MDVAMHRYTMFVALLFALFAACAPERSEDAGASAETTAGLTTTAAAGSGYDFARPDLTIELHADLAEISGLTLLADGRLGAVQDEDGILFVLDRTSGAIVERRTFAGAGDYEGVERANERIFILKSDGTLIEMSETGEESRVVETSLRRRNDAEGLGFDASNNRLLIACKEDPGAGLKNRMKAIYAYDIAAGALGAEPAFTIDTKEIDDRSDAGADFKPSAVAVHPNSGALYILSSTTKGIAILDDRGSLQEVVELDGELFVQPEAMVFLPDATLYIASEGAGGSGMLYAFRHEPTNP